jgi:hypothetical protein
MPGTRNDLQTIVSRRHLKNLFHYTKLKHHDKDQHPRIPQLFRIRLAQIPQASKNKRI